MDTERFEGYCPKCSAGFSGDDMAEDAKAEIRAGTHPGILCPSCREIGYVVIGVIHMECTK